MSRVLIVEDEVLIGLMLEDMLAMMGHDVCGNMMTLDDARGVIATQLCDVAILDVHVGGEPVFPLADELAVRGVAIIFATGSSSDALPAAHQHHVLLQKPFAYEAVETAISALRK